MWMLPYAGRAIVRWNAQTGETREYTGFPAEFVCIERGSGKECELRPFSTMAFYGDYLYLAPQQANMYLRLQIYTGQFEQWIPPFEDMKESSGKKGIAQPSGFFLHWKPEEPDGRLKVYSNTTQRLYHINMKTNKWEEMEIKFDVKELEEHEQGFGECSEILKYACAENVFNSLDKFIEGTTVGNPFDKKKQLEAYKRIAANSDGSCGKKIYEYMKAQD